MDQKRALEVFCAVADEGGLAGAARALSISPPTVTRIVNELETYLGAPLLHRTTRSITLTQTGAAYLADARRILEDLATADEAARGDTVKPTGALRITASVLFGQHYIAPIVREFVDLYPDVWVEGVFVDRIVNIIDEGIDISVRIGPLADSTFRAVRVGAVRHVVCGCPSYFREHGAPKKPSDLANHKIIDFDGIGKPGVWTFDSGVSVKFKPRMQFSTIAPCIHLAKSGWGLTRVLSYQIGPELGAGGLQTVLNEFSTEEWPIHLVHPEGRQRSAKVKCFLELAAERLRKDKFLN